MDETLREKAKLIWKSIRGDGCSSVPDFNSRYRGCCNRHDRDYRTHVDSEGWPLTKAQADARFRHCLQRRGKTFFGRNVLSWIYWAGVALAGQKHWDKNEHFVTIEGVNDGFAGKESDDSRTEFTRGQD